MTITYTSKSEKFTAYVWRNELKKVASWKLSANNYSNEFDNLKLEEVSELLDLLGEIKVSDFEFK